MITHIHTATIFVRDENKAVEFYTQKLGFELITDMPMGPDQRWLELAPPGAPSHILLYKPTPDQPGADTYEGAMANIGKFQPILFRCDSVQKTYEELSAKGVKFPTPAKQESWGMWAVFEDQDGNSFGLSESS